MTPNQIASFVANARCCENCGVVFDSVNHPHVDDDCTKNYALWEPADQEQIAARLHRMLIESKGVKRMSSMTEHGIVKVLRRSWDIDKSIMLQTEQWMKERLEAADEIVRLRDQIVALHTVRPFVVGFNEGWDAAVDSGEADARTAKKPAFAIKDEESSDG